MPGEASNNKDMFAESDAEFISLSAFELFTRSDEKNIVGVARLLGIEDLLDRPLGRLSGGYHSNWCGVLHRGLGLAGLALLGEEPDAPLWIERAKEQIIAFLNAGGIDGRWAEGLGYWTYGVGYAVLFIDALRRVTGEDLYVHPYLRKTPYFPVYAVMPDFSGYVNFADSWYGGVRGLVSLLFRLSSEYKNPYSQWTALKILGLRGSDTSSLHWNLLWYDPSLKPKSPSGSLPSSKVFRGIRWVIIRTGWYESDMLLATKGSELFLVCRSFKVFVGVLMFFSL